MSNVHLLFAAVTVLMVAHGARAATPLITETFSGSSGTNLVGTTTSDGNNWIGSSNTRFKADGSINPSGQGASYLGFAFSQGPVYTLQFDLNPAAGSSGNWLATGFSTDTGDGDRAAFQDGANAYAWFLYRDNGDATSLTGLNASGTEIHASPVGNTFQIVLDTSNALDYTIQYFDGGGSLRGPVSIGTPALDNIWISSFNLGGSFDNLTLTSTTPIPEPGSLALLCLGGLGLLLRRRLA